jgi:cytosine/adenosine deaminase-related metal-dependent hydrolase
VNATGSITGTTGSITGITPGLVCSHHHLYSTLARGMPAPPATPRTFRQVLEQIWWRLDTALDLDMLEWSAKLGALEALEAGCTAIIDHHESPNAIEGSLSVIADACADVGVRVSTCYGVTDRHGADGARRGLAENDRYLAAGGRGMVGIHAAFTCSDETLHAAADLAARHGVGVHVHVAEGPDDVEAPSRLAGLTGDDWLLVHGVHLPDDHGLRGTVVHNPRSNMNNAVGYARPRRFANPVALGTDGIGADMIAEFQLAFVAARADDVTVAPDVAWAWLEEGWTQFPDARTDVVTWSYDPMEPWQLAYTPTVHAIDVVVDGETVLRGGDATRVDAAEVRAKAAEQARRLHARL